MNTTFQHDTGCGSVMDQIDGFLDRELAADAVVRVSGHLATCESCRREVALRTAERQRIREAVSSVSASPDLRRRIEMDLARGAAQRGRGPWLLSAAAAVALTLLSGTVAYERGHLRWTDASRQSYIATISQRVGGLMSVGLADHVHCAVFGPKRPKQTPEQIQADMGPDYTGLVKVVREHLPGDQSIVCAHRCRLGARPFVHIAFVDGRHLSSLVIAKRKPGEDFATSNLAVAATDVGLPIYRASVHRFEITGYETSEFLVYLISDMSESEATQMMARLATPVKGFLTRLEL